MPIDDLSVFGDVIDPGSVPPPDDLTQFGQEVSQGVPMAAGIARAAGQGATFGFGDELEASLRALASERNEGESFGDAYRLEVDQIRDQIEAFAEENPGIALASEVAGGFAVPGAGVVGLGRAVPALARVASPLRKGLTMGQRARRGGSVGAAEGAAFGSGKAENLEDVPEMAAGGALAGGAMGAVAPPVMALGGAVISRLAPTTMARRRLTNAIAQDFPDLEPEEAMGRVARRLEQARKGNPNAMLADVAGENVRNFIREAEMLAGPGRQMIRSRMDARQGKQLARISGSLRAGTQVPPGRARQAIETQMARRADGARPLYKEAFKKTLSPPAAAKLDEIASTPFGRDAIRAAKKSMASISMAPDGKSYRGVKWADIPPIVRADALKKGFDDMARKTAKPSKRADFQGMAREVRQAVDEDLVSQDGVSVYAQARQAWEDPSRYIDKIEDGAKIERASFDDVLEVMERGTQAEKEAYRLGAVNALVDKMRRDRADLPNMMKFFSSPDMRDKLLAMMPTEQARRDLRLLLASERRASESFARTRGSRTAPALAAKEEAERAASVFDLVRQGLLLRPMTEIVMGKIPSAARKVQLRMASKRTAEITDMITRQGESLPQIMGQ